MAKPVTMEFDFEGGVGVAPEAELVDRGLETGVIQAGFIFDGQALGRNRGEVISRLGLQASLAAQLRTELRLALGV